MKDALEYKGYLGSVHYNAEDKVFYGKIEYIRSLVSYEGRDAKSVIRSFREAVDDYLALCNQQGHEPEKPFSGFLKR